MLPYGLLLFADPGDVPRTLLEEDEEQIRAQIGSHMSNHIVVIRVAKHYFSTLIMSTKSHPDSHFKNDRYSAGKELITGPSAELL